MRIIVPVLLMFSCRSEESTKIAEPAEEIIIVDLDGDGYSEDQGDCDDGNELINPGVEESCDGLDNNCDGEIDEAVLSTFYADSDADGYGDDTLSIEACEVVDGYVPIGNDCNDQDSEIYPSADEECDGVDNNCDGDVDEGVGQEYYVDQDGDGFGDDATLQWFCGTEDDLSPVGGDCDDNNSTINPDSAEICDGVDNNCNGTSDEGVASIYYADSDGDGFGDDGSSVETCELPGGYVENNQDCDDSNSLIMPGAIEQCDGADNNCDGAVDEVGAVGSTDWYGDSDSDGYGDSGTMQSSCTQPGGFVSDATDCDDSDATVNPAAAEVCDGADNDCDGDIDDSDGNLAAAPAWYLDHDGDGYGDSTITLAACTQPVSYVSDNTDCDDFNAAVNSAATEVCDSIDNDCDGALDDADVGIFYASTDLYYADSDGDGYGDAAQSSPTCTPSASLVSDSTDCNDSDSAVNPAADETCDGVDNNCDGSTDEATAVDASLWYSDSDGDSFGDSASMQPSCNQPSGYVSDSTDCADGDAGIHPSAAEVCDAIDNDCDGDVDDADGNVAASTAWYLDHDGDGFGDSSVALSACTQPGNYVPNDSDCNDFDSAVNPSAIEVCDSIDNDCNADVDDADVGISYATADLYFTDGDGDGFGDSSLSASTCTPGSSQVSDSTDCNDSDAAVNPDADELCDGVDNNCDGAVDGSDSVDQETWNVDYDGDGYGSNALTVFGCSQPSSYVLDATDCDDLEANINPGADELCDSVDNNCDGSVDGSDSTDQITWYLDYDGDGHGGALVTALSCTQPANFVDNSDDCDDLDITVNPDETDVCDGIDNDCDGSIDSGSTGGGSQYCAAASCEEILADDPSSVDGIYYIEDDNGNAIEAFCEMDFQGGGWLSVFNFVHPGDSHSDAATLYSAITQNQDMLSAVEADTTSTAIHTSNIDLSNYQEVVYGWAPSPTTDVTHYGTYSDSSGLTGNCYLDGHCGDNVAVGDFYISTTGSTRTIYTGNSPTYPHVGLGFSGQIIVWGYDRNNSSYSNWANWYDGNPCCAAGNTSEIQSGGWRYVIYIR